MKKRFYASAIMGMALAAFGLSSCEEELQEVLPQEKQASSVMDDSERPSLAGDMVIPETTLRSAFDPYFNWVDKNDLYYITYKFLGNPTEYQKKIFKTYLLEWMSYANLNFKEVLPNENAEIRIQFALASDKDPQNWSYIGSSSREVKDQSKPTISFENIHSGYPESERSRLILHELGHMLGLQHEHQSPNSPLQYDVEMVYYWGAMTQKWDRDRTYNNIFNSFAEGRLDITQFDPKSVMLYKLPDYCYIPGTFIPEYNYMLSDMDKAMIRQKYPFNGKKRLFRCNITDLNGYKINKHFYTTSFEELYNYSDNDFVESSMGFILDHQEVGTKPLYRFFNPKTFDHFYTSNYDEYTKLRNTSETYKYEYSIGYVYTVQVKGTKPVYRLYNGSTGEHFYTISWDEVNEYKNKGFKYERIEFYVMNDYFK